MKYIPNRLLCLITGLFLYALGIVFTINAALGFAPWEVLHQGIANYLPITFGTVSILTGLIICIIDALLGEKLGLGTILNMLLIGLFIDLLQYIDVIPHPASLVGRLAFLLLGLFAIGVGSYFYIDAALGAGPRDSLMVALARKTGFAVAPCRIVIEGVALLVGWLLGGPVGMGTVIAVLAGGPMVQLAFGLFRFDVTGVENETLDVTIKRWKEKSTAKEKA